MPEFPKRGSPKDGFAKLGRSPVYSSRKAIRGSILAALRAGI